MLKLTFLVLLVTVDISWSQVDARSAHLEQKRAVPWKRQVSYTDKSAAIFDQLSEESQVKFTKERLASRLLMSVIDNPREFNSLTEAYERVIDKKYDNMDEYLAELHKIYEKVLGRKPYTNSKSE